MTHRIFIDGEAGTTGLQIRDRLAGRADIALVAVDADRRKDPDARRAAMAAADVAILCLPDDAAREAAALAAGTGVRIIDASTAHRTAPDWTYGFPELALGQRAAIAGAARVSNPGCYATGAIAILAPLVAAGMVAPDERVAIAAVSGYSGGGKAMIAEFAAGTAPPHFLYGLTQAHKHVPEILLRTGLTTAPVFAPAVGAYSQGMAVQLMLGLDGRRTLGALKGALAAHYDGARFVTVGDSPEGGRIDPTALNGSNHLAIHVQGNPATGAATVIAILDNLGKGASGAAVQNLNLMLGCDEGAGL